MARSARFAKWGLAAGILGVASLVVGPQRIALAQGDLPGPEYPVADKSEAASPIDWVPVIRALKPLSRPRGARWPMICWENAPMTPHAPELVREQLERGFVPHVRMEEKLIGVAQSIQAAGGPVVLMEGRGGTFPYNKAGEPAEWAHQLPADFKGKKTPHACLAVHAGWRVQADETRRVLRAFKAAGVRVDAAWLDWEGEPMGAGADSFLQASACARCRQTLPAWALESPSQYMLYARMLAPELLSAYLAGPIADVFPGCATTNWEAIASTRENPVLTWESLPLPAMRPGLFTMTNPVAYGNSVFYNVAWDRKTPIDALAAAATRTHSDRKPTREQVDQLFFHLLLRGVSVNQRNIEASTPWVRSAPWVSRWCPDDMSPSIPMMSRERYREALRHIWLRGAAAMQVFNPTRRGYRAAVVAEVEDAQSVYNESLAWNDFILGGVTMNLAFPREQDEGVVWSGMRLADKAVVRVFKQGGGEGEVSIVPFPNRPQATVTLKSGVAGKTYFLGLDGDRITISPAD